MNAFDLEVASASGDAREIIRQYYGVDISKSNAEKYLSGIRLHLKTSRRLETNKQTFEQEEVNYNKDHTQTIRRDIFLTEDEKASPVKIMQKCGFDPLLWEVVTCRVINGSWDVTIKNADFEGVKHTNRKYSVTLTVKPLGGKLTMPQVLEAFASLPPVKVAQYKREPGNFMLELPIMDLHLGKLSWGEETGGDDYDLKIAESLWKDTILDILSKVQAFGKPELILFPIGQDFFHFDTPGATTTAGTALDSDSRWQKMFAKGVELLVWALEQCRALAPVKVLWIPGNHDTVLSYAATVGIAQRYHNTEDVEVDLSPTPRKYFLYGLNLIGFAHGVEEGKRIENLMQVEVAEEWGASVWREFHLGHLHSESAYSKGGVVFRHIASITAADAWTAGKGFLGATRQAQAFVWDKERGLQMILNSNVRAQ